MKKISIFRLLFLMCTLFSIANSMEEIKKKQLEVQSKSGNSVNTIAACKGNGNNIVILLFDGHTNDKINTKVKHDVAQHAPKNSFFVIEDIEETSSAAPENDFSENNYLEYMLQVLRAFSSNTMAKSYFLVNLSSSLRAANIPYKNIEFRKEGFGSVVDNSASKICQEKIDEIEKFSNKLSHTNKEALVLKEYIKKQDFSEINDLYNLLTTTKREWAKDTLKAAIFWGECDIIDTLILKTIYEKKATPFTVVCAGSSHCARVFSVLREQKYTSIFFHKGLCYCDTPQSCGKMHIKRAFETIQDIHQITTQNS